MTPRNTRRRRGSMIGIILLLLLAGVVLGGGAYYLARKELPFFGRTWRFARQPDALTPEGEHTPPSPPHADPVTGLTIEEIVTLGADGYMKQHRKKTGDDSEAGEDEAAAIYARAKALDNDAHLEKLAGAQQAQVREARTLLREWSTASYQTFQALAGGGTLYAHLLARDAAAQEDLLGALIDAMNDPPDAGDRKAADAALRECARQMKEIAGADFSDPMYAGYKKQYQESTARMKALLPKLTALAKALPDTAARGVAESARDTLAVGAL